MNILRKLTNIILCALCTRPCTQLSKEYIFVQFSSLPLHTLLQVSSELYTKVTDRYHVLRIHTHALREY